MNDILLVEASARTSRSLSRGLAEAFRTHWRDRFPGDRFTRRDVGIDPPPLVSEAWIAAAFTDEAARTDEQRRLLVASDELIAEVERSRVIVIATPMYNYGMPAALKAWLDQVIRIGRTFSFDLARGDYPLRPILDGKILVMLTSAGEFGFQGGGRRASMDHLVPHLRTASHYLGVTRHHHVGIEYQEFGDRRHARSRAAAHAAVPGLVEAVAADLAVMGTADGGSGTAAESAAAAHRGRSRRGDAIRSSSHTRS